MDKMEDLVWIIQWKMTTDKNASSMHAPRPNPNPEIATAETKTNARWTVIASAKQ